MALRWFRNIRASIQLIGLWPYCVYVLGRMLRAASCGDAVHYCLMAVDLKAVLNARADPDAQQLMALKRGDPRLELIDVPLPVVRQRLDQGATCLALTSGTQLQGCIWYVSNIYDEDEVRAQFILPPTAVWDFGAYVAPQYRLGRSFERLWHGFARASVRSGSTYSVSRIATHNTASLRAHMRLPHTVLGYCSFIRVFSLQFCLSPLLSGWHVCRTEQDKPVFQVHL